MRNRWRRKVFVPWHIQGDDLNLMAAPHPDARMIPPKELVVVGFYRYVRNPMYLGSMFGWIGLWIVFGQVNLLAVAIAFGVVLGVVLFVVLYEEPTLRRKFGAEYEEYCRNVPRWIPRLHLWHSIMKRSP